MSGLLDTRDQQTEEEAGSRGVRENWERVGGETPRQTHGEGIFKQTFEML